MNTDAAPSTTFQLVPEGTSADRDPNPGPLGTAQPEPDTTKANRSDRWYLSAAPIWRALVHLCVPMAAGMSVGAIYNLINAGFIGSLHDTALLAAITFGLPLLGLVMAVGGVFGVGGGALISRLFGASERDPAQAARIKNVSSFAAWGSVLAGAVVGGIGLLLLHPLVRLLGADPAAVPATTAYVAVMLAFVPVMAATFCLEQLIRAEGAARQSMIGLIASTVANLVFDVVFILLLGWGVAGAALAIGLSNLVSVAYYAWFLQRRSTNVDLSPRWFTLDPAIVRPVFGVGVGELLQSGFLIVTALVLNNLAVGYGDAPLAAFGVALRIVQLPEFLVMGVTIGVLPLLAYSFGKGDGQRLSATLRAAAIAVAVIVGVFSTSVFLVRGQVFGAFSADPSVFRIGVLVLAAQLVATIVNGFTGLFTTLFQATGRSLPAIVMSVVQGALFLPVVLLANWWFGLSGIIWAMTVTEGVVFGIGAVLWLASRRSIHRELAGGSPSAAPLEGASQSVTSHGR
jgi:multidrug efflux pump